MWLAHAEQKTSNRFELNIILSAEEMCNLQWQLYEAMTAGQDARIGVDSLERLYELLKGVHYAI